MNIPFRSQMTSLSLRGIRFVGGITCATDKECTRLLKKYGRKIPQTGIEYGDVRITFFIEELSDDGFVFDRNSLTFKFSSFTNTENGICAILFWA